MHVVKVSIRQEGKTADRLVEALMQRMRFEAYGPGRYKVVLSAGERAFAIRSVERLLADIAADEGVDDWTEHLQVQ